MPSYAAEEKPQGLEIARKRTGKGFAYFYASGRKVNSRRVLKRLKQLVIPPNWQQVSINRDPSADLQATGFDNKGRKQYIYHPNWHKARQQEKFSRLGEFAAMLPAFRQECWTHIDDPVWSREKTLSLVCLILDHTGLRAGNRHYTQTNHTYGLTTLRRKHVCEDDGSVRLSFIGKHRQARDVEIEDPELSALVAESAEQQGYALFRYIDKQQRWHDVSSDDVNAYIHQKMGEGFSCKDFRTWGASRFGLLSFPRVEDIVKRNRRRRWEPTLVKEVSSMLGNTPNVCKQYYLHPKLLSRFSSEKQRDSAINKMRALVPEDVITDDAIKGAEAYLAKLIVE